SESLNNTNGIDSNISTLNISEIISIHT
ncbi:MAG: hypothetical protein K0Q49_1989, partial [Haloplasmataceae bacterium]|nr:hypothetical protein [Haloplasmataceae bacterium]